MLNYRLTNISKIKIYFFSEIVEKMVNKKMKRLVTISNIIGAELIIADVAAMILFILTFTGGVALSGITILLPLANAASQRSSHLL